MRPLKIAIILAGLGLSGPVAHGQDSAIERLERQLRQAEQSFGQTINPALSPNERAMYDYGGIATFNFLAIDDADQKTHILRQTDVQLYGRANFDNAHQFFGRARFTYRDFNTGDSFDGNDDELAYPLADRWWYQFDLANAAGAAGNLVDFNARLKVGRQWVDWGSGMVLSDQLYAALLTLEIGDWQLMGLAGTTPRSSVVDFDSSRRSFDSDTARNFFGGMVTYQGISGHRPYFFALTQLDRNGEDDDVLSGGGVPVPTEFDYNSTYLAVGSTGATFVRNLAYHAEVVYEMGDGLSNSFVPGSPPLAQTREDVEAWAARAGLVYVLKDANRTRLEFEAIVASGDSDREFDTSNTFGGNRSGTKDKSFNAFGFAKTGLAFGAPISNLMMFRGGASTYPVPGDKTFRNLQVGVDLIAFNKFNDSAPFDEGTSDDHYLGFETDFYLHWRITSDVSLNLSYGVFFPGEAIQSDHDARHFFYSGITYSF